jgi:hypothetical protein
LARAMQHVIVLILHIRDERDEGMNLVIFRNAARMKRSKIRGLDILRIVIRVTGFRDFL